jgi:hypothetical protein
METNIQGQNISRQVRKKKGWLSEFKRRQERENAAPLAYLLFCFLLILFCGVGRD